jgi:hypothetical protein
VFVCVSVLLIYSFILPGILLFYSYFTRCVCVCVCRLTGLVECVEQSEGLRRDGAWKHGVLQQSTAGEAPLHEPPHVCLLMHVGAAQARTRLQERQRVSTAEQVREMSISVSLYSFFTPSLLLLLSRNKVSLSLSLSLSLYIYIYIYYIYNTDIENIYL